MRSGFLRQMAQQCRDMIGRARTDAARQQLHVWSKEFDAQAQTAEEDEKHRNPHGGAHC